MGLSRLYWRSRAICNAAGSTAVSLVVTAGSSHGLPKLFRADYSDYKKAAEMMLTVGSSLLGFIIAAVSLMYALTASERFDLLRRSKSFVELAAASKASMFWLFTSSALGAALMFIDPALFGSGRSSLIFLSAFVAAQVGFSTAALTWVIGRLISLA